MKHHYTSLCIALIGLICMPLGTIGQCKYQFAKPNRNHKTIDFDIVHNLVVIPVQINDSDTLRFILDSGVRTPVLFGIPENSNLTLNNARKIVLEGYGHGVSVEAIVSVGNKMTLRGGIFTENQDMYVVPEDILKLSQYMGTEIHGIIGYDLYSSFVIKTNYTQKSLTFYNPETFDQPRKSWNRIPIRLRKYKPYIYAKVVQAEGDTIKANMIMDTGASFAFALLHGPGRSGRPPEYSFFSFLGKGMAGPIYGLTGRVPYCELGRFSFKMPIVNYPDSISSAKIMLDTVRDGNVGADIFSRFHLIVDYSRSCIYLKPNRRIHEKFTYNYSGIEIVTPNPEFAVYQVAYVDSLSSASLAGLRVGDQIQTVNGLQAVKMSMPEILAKVSGAPGHNLILHVFRKDHFVKIKIRIEDKTLPPRKKRRKKGRGKSSLKQGAGK